MKKFGKIENGDFVIVIGIDREGEELAINVPHEFGRRFLTLLRIAKVTYSFAWNSFPDDIRQIALIATFQSIDKTKRETNNLFKRMLERELREGFGFVRIKNPPPTYRRGWYPESFYIYWRANGDLKGPGAPRGNQNRKGKKTKKENQ